MDDFSPIQHHDDCPLTPHYDDFSLTHHQNFDGLLAVQGVADNPGGGGAADAETEEGAKVAGGGLAGEVKARNTGLELVVQRGKALFHLQGLDDAGVPEIGFAGQFNR